MKFSPYDYTIVVAYLSAVVLFGLRFRARGQTLNHYFLGGRTLPWWAISFSIVATETSILSIVGLPALAYASNMLFFQLIIGNLVGRILVCIIFIPKYYSGQYITAYEFLGTRFGRKVQRAAAGLFVFTRVFSEGVRAFAAALVVSLILGTDIFTSLLLIICLTLIYTVAGGVRAVIWTDVTQFWLYMGGAGLALYYALTGIPEGWAGVVQAGGSKLVFLDFSLDPLLPYTFWSGMVAGIFQTLAFQGTDQLLVQRLLAARTKNESRIAVIVAAIILTAQYFFLLLLGVVLFVFFEQHPPATPFEVVDQVFPFLVINHLPIGISGLVVAGMLAAAMSTTSSSLNSIASSSVVDLYPNAQRLSPQKQLRLARGFTVIWAAVLLGIGMFVRDWGTVVEAGLKILSITYGSLLGIFLIGLWTRMRSETAGLTGMAAGLLAVLAVEILTPVPWPWFFAIGTLVTLAVGWVAAQILSSWGVSHNS